MTQGLAPLARQASMDLIAPGARLLFRPRSGTIACTRPAVMARTRMKTRLSTATLALMVATASIAAVRVRDVRMPMGTYMAITVYAPTQAAGKKAMADAFEHVEKVEAAISTYRYKSEISQLNRAAGGEAIAVGEHLYALLTRSAEVSKETDGAFDITAGPLIRLWKKAWRKQKLPTPEELAAARALVDYRSVRLFPTERKAQLLKKNMRLDVGAIGKGYIIDQAVAALRAAGITAALVDSGGDIYAMGKPPGRDGWLVGVRDPERRGKILPRPLLVVDLAVATSGDYEQFGRIDAKKYSHILDPRTGRPVEGMSTVSLIAPDATTADAYATAASVLGPEAAVAFVEKRPKVEVLILHRLGDRLTRVQSSGFARLEARKPPAQ